MKRTPVQESAATVVLVIDDDPRVRTFVSHLLKLDGYQVVQAQDGDQAMKALDQHQPDLVLLDVMMPAVDGLDLLQSIREICDVPVIMLTALGTEADRILGLRSGADDYVVKPFSPGELTARIESLLRRARRREASGRLEFGDLAIESETREVRLRGESVVLTAREFDLLAFLAASPRQVFGREQLLKQVWESSGEWQDASTVTEMVYRLRRKLEADPDKPRWLKTVRGVGYRFEP